MPCPRWLVYALGGGFGHLTRACALARAALPDTRVVILTNSSYASYVASALPELDIHAVNDGKIALDADCFIVDTFPRGLVGELVNILSAFSGVKVLVQRDLNPDYLAKYNVPAFVADSYDLVVTAGDSSPFPRGVMTAPWLIRSPGEVPDRDCARRFLGLRRERPCVLVCAAGNVEELAWFGAVVTGLLEHAPDCDIRCIAPVRPDACPTKAWIRYWPAMDLYSAADVLIGGGGYNTVYESLACGVPLVARPWPRKYDRQILRARRAGAKIVDAPSEAVSAAIDLLTLPAVRPSGFSNGALEAVAHIRQKLLHLAGPRDIHRL